MPVLIGLDCGGSSTRALAMDEEGNVLQRGQSGPANLSSTPEHRLRGNVQYSVRDFPTPDAVAGCFAGLIGEDRRDFALNMVQSLFPTAVIRVEPDFAAAYAADPVDICIIAGTGSLVCSRTAPLAPLVRSGGLGYLLGDEGSGFRIGRGALRAYLLNRDQVGQELREAIGIQFGSEDPAEIVPRVYATPGSPAQPLAKLVKPFSRDLARECPYAVALVASELDALSTILAQHVHQFHTDRTELEIGLAGGVWKASSIFVEVFRQQCESKLPDRTLRIHKVSTPPVVGAVKLARELLATNH
ncbi:MAG: N-acetylglucosamine kinase [Fimbriimonas sp.]